MQQTIDDRDERVRARAYQIWEQEGRPDGQHDAHWDQARREMADEPPTGAHMPGSGGVAPPGGTAGTNGAAPPAGAGDRAREPGSVAPPERTEAVPEGEAPRRPRRRPTGA